MRTSVFTRRYTRFQTCHAFHVFSQYQCCEYGKNITHKGTPGGAEVSTFCNYTYFVLIHENHYTSTIQALLSLHLLLCSIVSLYNIISAIEEKISLCGSI